MIHPFDNASSARGFSMVEVLVALVVLAVGMLGIAGLYVTALRASGTAVSRMQAVTLAGDLADRIRANPNAAATYEMDPAEATDKGCVGGTEACTPAELAETDLFLWHEALAVLPGDPVGEVETTDGSPRAYNITIRWAESTESKLSYTLRMRL
jgi:type IV pilus assembly protein PilV